MTMDHIRSEMIQIKQLKKTDIQDARERWLALRERIESYSKVHKLPEIWKKILLEEIQKV